MQVQSLRFFEFLKKIIDLIIVYLQKRTVDIEILSLALFESFDFLKQWVNSSRDKSSIVLIWHKILKKSILLFLTFVVLWDRTLPIASEHCVGFTWTGLSIGEYCHIVALWYFWDIISEQIEHISLVLIFGDCLVEFCLDHGDYICGDFDCFALG